MRQESDSILEAYIRRALRAEEECARLNQVVSTLRQRHREFARMLKEAMPEMQFYKVNELLRQPDKDEEIEQIDYWLARAGEIVAEFGE